MELETLPAELVSQILLSVHSLRELYRLISASHICLRVLASFPEQFLTAVLKEYIADTSLGDCLAIINVPPRTGNNEEEWRNEQLPYLVHGSLLQPGALCIYEPQGRSGIALSPL
ncbi:hypothetical protein B0T10DRAFT_572497 [Thelonectria olida]|uniref:F-box domain-containing protein n=1 Tax=Thelonectria olida TaxID=1576542 RepID=A0A9P9AS88_9HYPO|nr:hypothetical protein B0T10DRAFT_572497 [Thelonectria olida]